MKDRRLIGLLIILAIVIVNMGVVSASDGNSSYYEIPDDVDTISDTIAIENKTFEAIDYAIWQSAEEDVIELDGTYLSNGSSITIEHSLTLTGMENGAVLDFENLDGKIWCRQGNITFKNIKFINGNASHDSCINVNLNTQMNIINCSFESNHGKHAIINSDGHLTISQSYFADNTYRWSLIDAKDVEVKTTEFINITGSSSYGSIYAQFGSMKLENCKFINSILNTAKESTISNCSFFQSITFLGGIVSSSKFTNVNASYKHEGTMKSCRFVNSSLETIGNNVHIINSTFSDYNNYVIFIKSNDLNITDCSFRNSRGAIFINGYSIEPPVGHGISVSNSIFENLTENALNMPIRTKYSTALPPSPANKLSISNCKFANMKGGILWSAYNIRVCNSTFENLSNDGIFLYGDNPYVDGCVFNNITLDYYAAGAIYFNTYRYSHNGHISNSIFTNINGRAMSSDISNLNVINCSINNMSSTNTLGGANIINCSVSNSQGGFSIIRYPESANTTCIINCSFINNTALQYGDVLSIDQFNQSSVINSHFINNNMRTIESNAWNFSVYNSTFIGNHGTEGCAIYHYGTSLIVDGSQFIRNNGEYAAIQAHGSSIFTNNMFLENNAERTSCIALHNPNWKIENCRFINNTASNNRDVEGCEKMVLSQIGNYYGDISLKVTVTDNRINTPLANETIAISWNNHLYTYNTRYKQDKTLLNDFNTSNDGTVTIKLNNLNAGTYDPFIINLPEHESHETIIVKIKKAPIQIDAKKLTTTYNPNGDYSVKIINSKTKKVVPGIEVTLQSGSKTFKAFTDKNGNAKFSLSKFSIGTNKITVKVLDPNALEKKLTTSITLKKAKTIVSAPKVTNKVKKSKYFKVTVKTSDKKVLKNTYVKIQIDKKTYKIKTNSKGIAQYNTKSLKVGKHNVIITSGDSKFTMNAKSTIVIKR
ncbi:hypothetical protein [uncultured Methanobrevibacter sp.]|uniref:hypothetical protein n=1 Tax=uncultured Methanobrevibacter sp. TaxID=253161 RepID=UPI0026164AA4|nr:hypothetical protein [uncultured Methanobrevibacter sp.]